ncbi:low molecular weight phosphatase family protein [Sneathiella sp. P13V-1]|uniref:arsenate reductase ArsC n=1 Tax=Sneathiella sp. P13V-1 TaxID=2697366 RepID=UPI00187B8675|nr:arsenate reductase ArsC [Sneathiella sp. P13V-1]MBE7635256.1 low molecular weight phosphatase family protein [Sneathiella sp. P13V-1]
MSAAAPTSVLFACTHNSVRSPMAEAIMKSLYGTKIYVQSAGVRATEIDGFTIEVMDEIGLDVEDHYSKNFDELEDSSFDLIICLSKEAKMKADEITRTWACDVEHWITVDPSEIEGNREMRLNAYRNVRDDLYQKIKSRFATAPAPLV